MLRKHYPSLDGLRGIAVVAVVVFHATSVLPDGGYRLPDQLFRAAARLGWCGVDLFFVLSGFLITGLLLDAKGSERYFRDFYARRTLRIFPLYYASLAAFALLPILGEPLGATAALSLATYTQNLLVAAQGAGAIPRATTHFWSLAIEEQFYLVWPIVVLVTSRRQLAAVSGVAIVGALALRLALVASGNGLAAFLLTPSRLDALAWGALLALAIRERGAIVDALLARSRLVAAGAGAAFAAVVAVRGRLEHDDPVLGTIGVSLLALLFAAWLVSVVNAPDASALQRLHRWGPLRALGKYSYAVYVVHLPLIWASVRNGAPEALAALPISRTAAQVLFSAAVLAASVLVALATWHLLEKRCAALKRHFEPARVPAPPEPVAVGEKPAA